MASGKSGMKLSVTRGHPRNSSTLPATLSRTWEVEDARKTIETYYREHGSMGHMVAMPETLLQTGRHQPVSVAPSMYEYWAESLARVQKRARDSIDALTGCVLSAAVPTRLRGQSASHQYTRCDYAEQQGQPEEQEHLSAGADGSAGFRLRTNILNLPRAQDASLDGLATRNKIWARGAGRE